MTDEEEARVREVIRAEVQARMLKVPFEFDSQDAGFCDDMRWHYPRAYQRITKEVLDEFHCSIDRINELKSKKQY
jgi:hypothetical protein